MSNKHPTLVGQVDQFLYSYAQNLPNKKSLIQLVQHWEEAYQARIVELEEQIMVLSRSKEPEVVEEPLKAQDYTDYETKKFKFAEFD